MISKGCWLIEIFAPPKGNNCKPVALIIISASSSFPELNLMPFSVNVSIVSVSTYALPFLIALKKVNLIIQIFSVYFTFYLISFFSPIKIYNLHENEFKRTFVNTTHITVKRRDFEKFTHNFFSSLHYLKLINSK